MCLCVLLPLQGPASLLPDALLPGSVLGAITGDEAFFACWIEVLTHQATQRLEEAKEGPDPWQVRGRMV